MNLRDLIYFININSALKGVGRYNKGELTCLDENPDKNVSPNGIYNFGFDNDQADYNYESKDQINYRYEIHKKLGKGAFGVVLKCYDHKLKE